VARGMQRMSEELTPEVLAELRGLLEAKRANLQSHIPDLRRAVGAGSDFENRTDSVGDSGDSSVDLQQGDENRVTQDDLAYQLAEVQHALDKFDDGTYGLCEAGDGPIPLARLRIIPEARFDAKHQAEYDARQDAAFG
jgi:DnaK suppressor protein